MNITKVVPPTQHESSWKFYGANSEVMMLPAVEPNFSGVFRIGVIGTRSDAVKIAKTQAFANSLEMLGCPIYLIDIRRTGAGGSGSWGPLEFSSTVPKLIPDTSYSYYHLPQLAPELDLLRRCRTAVNLLVVSEELLRAIREAGISSSALEQLAEKKDQIVPKSKVRRIITSLPSKTKDDLLADVARPNLDADQIHLMTDSIHNQRKSPVGIPDFAWKHWQIFSAEYRQINTDAITIGRAFVEAAEYVDGIAIFLCAEEHEPSFDDKHQQEQDEVCCHRYTFTTLVARAVKEAFPTVRVERWCLRLGHDPDVQTLNDDRQFSPD